MAPPRYEHCIDAVKEALGPEATDDRVAVVFERVQARRRRLEAEGRVDRLQERVRDLVAADADAERIAAAKARQHAALTAITRDRLETQLLAMVEGGLDLRQAVLAKLEGTARGVAGGRASVAATGMAYRGRFAIDMLAEIQRERPHLVDRRALGDQQLSDDVVREMWEIGREGGQPGRTGNDDARFLAGIFAKYLELSRTDLNRLGAAVGTLGGYVPQAHDDWKLIRAGRERWVAAVLPRLDMERTFPGVEPAKAVEILGSIYDTIVTGVRATAGAAERGEHTAPSNWANRLGAHRVLHFKSADDALAYARDFGHGNAFTAVWGHQEVAARSAAMMQEFGPNPEVMGRALLASLQRRARSDAALAPEVKHRLARDLTLDQGSIASAWAIAAGEVNRPFNLTAATLGSSARGVAQLGKLGFALASSVSDLTTAAANLKFHGRSFFGEIARQVRELVTVGRGAGEQKEITFLLGEAFEGLTSHMHAWFVAGDAAPGWMARAQAAFFRWNGLTWWTEANRAVVARTMAAELAMRARTPFAELPAKYRHVLSLHGIGERQWAALAAVEARTVRGTRYITPDLVRGLDDMTVGRLVEGRVTGAKIHNARRDLELALRRFIADEGRFAILEADAAARRFTTLGERPGTIAGEAARLVMTFKAHPISFVQRVLGRAWAGGEGQSLAGAGHIGALVAGLLVSGYAAMTLKDLARGYGPRNPTSWKTILAAFQQSGGLGIYGDFLFGQANRLGGGVGETIMGPVLGEAANIANLALRARDGEAKAGEAFNVLLNNTPFINLHLVRPALDWLVLNSIREGLSPGFVARQEQRRFRDYGQTPWHAATVRQSFGG